MAHNVFVVGLDPLGRRLLATLNHVEEYAFHPLLPLDEVVYAGEFPFDRLIHDARAELDAFPGAIDAIVGYWDFPTSALLPLLQRTYGLRGPTLEAVLKCEHKYWSRLEQAEVVPGSVPPFQVLDPFAEDALARVCIDYPLWIKPIKSHSSHLGFRIADADELAHVLPLIRAGIGKLARPFEEVMAYAELPPAIQAVNGHCCILEGLISAGRQCTLEGYVQHGEMTLMGIVDSVRDRRHRSVLMRYVYPSRLPDAVQRRMVDQAERVMRRIGYDNGAFNIEFYHEQSSDRIWLLEVNARLSRSHAALFRLVEGVPHFQVMVDLGLGLPPRLSHRQGRYPMAAKQMMRVFADGLVKRVPTAEEIRRVEARFPGAMVMIGVTEGMRLSTLLHQDSFSYEVGILFVGGQSERDLRRKIRSCLDMLPLEIEPLAP